MNSALVLACLLAAAITGTHQQDAATPSTGCSAEVDIIIAVDRSGSLRQANFDAEINAVIDMISDQDISPTTVRAGIVFFSASTSMVRLQGDKAVLLDALRNAAYPGGNTHTDLAIDAAVTEFGINGRGGTVPQLLVIITDGQSTEPDKTKISGDAAKAKGISIYTIGVTSGVSTAELEDLASTPDQAVVSPNFDNLPQLLSDAVMAFCQVVVAGPMPVCTTQVDLVIAVDGSGSLTEPNYRLEIEAVINLLKSQNISPNENHAGVVVFSHVVTDIIPLQDDVNAIVTALNALNYPGSVTRTDLAIDEAVQQFANNGRGGNVPQILVVITDGISTEPTLTQQAGDRAKAANIDIFAVGVTSGASPKELEQLASSPDKAIISPDFSGLEDILKNAVNQTCFTLTPTPLPACNMGYTDIWTVVDVSSTTETLARLNNLGDFDRLEVGLSGMFSAVQDANMSNPGVRLGLVAHSADVQTVVSTTDADSVQKTLQSVTNFPGLIVPQNQVQPVLSLGEITEPPVSSNRLSYVIYVSSGPVNQIVPTETTRLKNLGYTIVTVAVNVADTTQYQNMASAPELFYSIPDYSVLEETMKNFTLENLCFVDDPTADVCAQNIQINAGLASASHSTDCDKYIQCYYTPGGGYTMAVVRQCGQGMFWNDTLKACTSSCSVDCINDPCRDGCSPSYAMAGSCRGYWQCVNGKSSPACCPMNQAFVDGKGCVDDATCTDYCGPSNSSSCSNGVCNKRISWTSSAGYNVPSTTGSGLTAKPCVFQDFDIVDCGCTAARGQTCSPDRSYDFTGESGTVASVLRGTATGIQGSGIGSSANGATLSSTSSLNVDVNQVASGSNPLTVQLSYRENQMFDAYGEVLLSSGDNCCSGGGSLIVVATDQYVTADIKSSDGRSAQVKVQTTVFDPTQFKHLILSYDAGLLTLVVRSNNQEVIASVQAPSDIRFPCGIDIGSGFGKNPFDGTVQQLDVSSCTPSTLYSLDYKNGVNFLQ